MWMYRYDDCDCNGGDKCNGCGFHLYDIEKLKAEPLRHEECVFFSVNYWSESEKARATREGLMMI